MKGLFHQPLRPFEITQKFGQNSACKPKDGSRKVIYCDGNNPPEGYVSLYGANGHGAIDLRARHGQEVYCAQNGTIVSIDTNPRTGLDVRIETHIDGRRFKHVYEHLLGYQGQKGDYVRTGQLIGWADNTGWSSGDHLHFQIEEYINGKWVKIDPLSVMSTMFALDVLKTSNTLKYLTEQVAKLADNLADYLRQRGK